MVEGQSLGLRFVGRLWRHEALTVKRRRVAVQSSKLQRQDRSKAPTERTEGSSTSISSYLSLVLVHLIYQNGCILQAFKVSHKDTFSSFFYFDRFRV